MKLLRIIIQIIFGIVLSLCLIGVIGLPILILVNLGGSFTSVRDLLIVWGILCLILFFLASVPKHFPRIFRWKNGDEISRKLLTSSNFGKMSNCVVALFIYGILNIASGLAPLIFNIEALRELGLGIFQLIAGIIFFILAYFVWKKSLIALITAIIIILGDLLYLLWGIYSIFSTRWADLQHDFVGLFVGIAIGVIVHIVILKVLVSGIDALRHLKKSEMSSSATPD